MSFSKAFDSVLRTVNATFGSTATYTHIADGTTDTLKGVLDNAFVEIGGGFTQVNAMRPVFRIRLADLSGAPQEGDTLTVNSNTYMVKENQDDAFGGSTLILEKA